MVPLHTLILYIRTASWTIHLYLLCTGDTSLPRVTSFQKCLPTFSAGRDVQCKELRSHQENPSQPKRWCQQKHKKAPWLFSEIIFASHTGCSYLSLWFSISKPIGIRLVYPVHADQKTFKQGEKPHILVLTPPLPCCFPTSSDPFTAHPTHLYAMLKQDRWIFHEKAARLTILKGFLGQQRRN